MDGRKSGLSWHSEDNFLSRLLISTTILEVTRICAVYSVRYIKCANGGEYKWIRCFQVRSRIDDQSLTRVLLIVPQLFDLDVKECRAKFERANFNFMTMKNKKATLDIKLDDIPDAAIAAKTCYKIVLSLIVMERWRRHFEVHARSDY